MKAHVTIGQLCSIPIFAASFFQKLWQLYGIDHVTYLKCVLALYNSNTRFDANYLDLQFFYTQ